MKNKIQFAAWILLMATAGIGPAQADTVFTVTLNTAPLVGSPGSSAGPFSLAFQLTDGSGLGDANNTATISDFQFGSVGSAGACPAACTVFGGASGDIGSTVVLTDSGFFNALLEGFTPGDSLSFLVDLTTNLDSGSVPDAFAFSILDGSGFSVPTLDPSGADTLLTVNLDSANPGILTYATDASRLTNGVSLSIGAPLVGPPVSSVPEPNSLLLMGAGIAGLALTVRKRSRR